MMNKGNWFSSIKKTTLTIINVVILGIACAIVCFAPLHNSGFLADKTSVDWVSTSREWPSTRALPRLAGPVPTTPPKCDYYGEHLKSLQCWKRLLYRFALVSVD